MEYVTKETFDATLKGMESEHQRLADEDERQNKRLAAIEDNIKETNKLVTSIETIALEVKHMREDVTALGGKVDEIEKKPAKRWESVVAGILGAIVGGMGTMIVKLLLGGV